MEFLKGNVLIVFFYIFVFLFLIDYENTIILIGRYGVEVEGNMIIVDAINGSKSSYIFILSIITVCGFYITTYILHLQKKVNDGFNLSIIDGIFLVTLTFVFLFEMINVYTQLNILLH